MRAKKGQKAQCVSNRCKELFKRKKYFGVRCTLALIRPTCIQLFRQRLSYRSVKAHVTMPIVIMGSDNLVLLDRGSRLFRHKEKA